MDKISFEQRIYKKQDYIRYKKNSDLIKDGDEEHYYTLKDLEGWNVLDICRYSKQELIDMVKDFLATNDSVKLEERLQAIRKSPKLIACHIFPQMQEYTPEYLVAFHKYLQTRKRTSGRQTISYKPKKEVVFRNVGRDQVEFLRQVMKDPRRRNLSLDQKQALLQEQFQK